MLTLVEEEEEQGDEDEGKENGVEDTQSSLHAVVDEAEQANSQAGHVECEEGEDDEFAIRWDFRGNVMNDAYEGWVVIVRPLYFTALIKGGRHLVFHL